MWVLEHINKQLDKNKQALATKKCAVKFYRTNFKAKDKPLPKLISTFFWA